MKQHETCPICRRNRHEVSHSLNGGGMQVATGKCVTCAECGPKVLKRRDERARYRFGERAAPLLGSIARRAQREEKEHQQRLNAIKKQTAQVKSDVLAAAVADLSFWGRLKVLFFSTEQDHE